MADILIRGIEMPTKCGLCPMFCDDFNDYCSAAQRSIPFDAEKPEWCPFVPLPEVHGRLIDADKLAEDLQLDVENDQRALDDLNIVGVNRERIQFDKDCKQNCMWYLSECPTIVPAEGGTDNGN